MRCPGHKGRRLAGPLPVAGLALIAIATPAFAHPDIAITLRVLFNIQKGRLTSLGESWTFDAQYSRALKDQFDRDRDGEFSKDEMAALGTRLRRDLASKGFFTTLRSGGQLQELGEITAFYARIDGDAVTVTFVMPLNEPVDPSRQSVDLLVRDEGYTAAFQLADRSALQIRGDERQCTVAVTSAPEDTYFADLVVPQKLTLICRP